MSETTKTTTIGSRVADHLDLMTARPPDAMRLQDAGLLERRRSIGIRAVGIKPI
jgi:hypothetical protein